MPHRPSHHRQPHPRPADGLRRRHWLAATAGGLVFTPTLRAQDASPIVIGQSAHLSGPLAPTFTPVLAGQKLALDEFNARGGVAGRKVQLITLDDAYVPKRCVENVQQLIGQHQATALFGLASTANVGAVLPLLADRQVPLVGVYTGSPTLRARQHPYFFSTMASYRDEVVQMVKNLKTVARTQIGLVYQASPFGQLMLPVVEEVCKDQGVSLTARAPLEASGANAATAAQAMAGAQAVILMAFGPSIVPFVKAARAAVAAPIYAVSIANAKPLIDALGDDARGLAITQTIPSPFRATSALFKDFQAQMARAQLPVDHDHFFGYLNLRVLLEALRRSGKTVTPATLVTTIERMGRTDLGGYTVTYGPQNHHGSSYVDITIVGPRGRFIG